MRMRMRNNKHKTWRYQDTQIPYSTCHKARGIRGYLRFPFHRGVILLGLDKLRLSRGLRKRPNDSEVHKSSAVDLTNWLIDDQEYVKVPSLVTSGNKSSKTPTLLGLYTMRWRKKGEKGRRLPAWNLGGILLFLKMDVFSLIICIE